MPGFRIDVPHQLGQEAATERLRGFLDNVRERYQSQVSDLEESWSDDTLSYSFKTYGFKIKGAATVAAEVVTLQADLPFAAVAFKGKIEQSIREELEKILA